MWNCIFSGLAWCIARYILGVWMYTWLFCAHTCHEAAGKMLGKSFRSDARLHECLGEDGLTALG